METEKWCMCENLDGVSVARDMKSTCGRCRGIDAYGSSPMRPEKYRKQLKAKRDVKNLHQCPYSPATTCKMDEPCLGCETYAEWESKNVCQGDCIDEIYGECENISTCGQENSKPYRIIKESNGN